MLSKLELKRKIWHIVMGLTFIFLVYDGLFDVTAVLGLLLISVIIVVVQKRRMSRVMHFIFEQIEREENLKENPALGMVFYLMGALIVMVILPREVFLAVMLILTIGDAAAPLIGQFGKKAYFYNKKKKWEGIIAGIIFGAAAAMFFVPWYEAILAASAAMILEGFDLKVMGWAIDDNFLIPIVAGIVIGLLKLII